MMGKGERDWSVSSHSVQSGYFTVQALDTIMD